ncbi:glucosamine inositolphosphorylceramide transferase family protein [Aquimarina sediminis]|uniref:glucosamine inositolphosphorylceramide transferase family protein n=1 Tax=Aquimarina sediminis TaxID=2070536 RepID=UPI000CA031B2|nr:hypothetical protein [Aquimarina sediminis]
MKGSDDLEEMWSIKIYTGNSPLQLKPKKNDTTPSITRHDVTDISASFVADPFMIPVDNIWHLFMEILNTKTGNGEIGLVTSVDGVIWDYQQVVLKENYHLSYPFVFKNKGTYYMVPETLDANAIRLYKAMNFPNEWEFQTNLVTGQYADPTLFQHNNHWWIFASDKKHKSSTLTLFYANNLEGPYVEHPKNPIIEKNQRIARPAGRIIEFDHRIIRLCQDCYPKYGSAVRAFEITELSPENYNEHELPESPILKQSKKEKQWNSRGMHHLDAHKTRDNQWIASVDGCYSNTVNL